MENIDIIKAMKLRAAAISTLSLLFISANIFAVEKPTALFLVNAEPATQLYSMGDIFSSASFGDAFYNPWMLGLVTVPGISMSHWPGMISKSNYNFAGLVVPLKKGGAFSMSYLGYDVGEELIYELDGTSRNVKLEDDKVLALGYGFPIGERLFVGLAAKSLQSTLAANYTATAALGDLGLMFNTPNSKHTFGLSLKNYGQKITYLKTEEPLPAEAKAGYTLKANKWTLGISYYTLLAGSIGGISAGLEYAPDMRFIKLRAGAKQINTSLKAFAGIGFDFGRMDIDFGYQVVSNTEVASELPVMFTLNWFFGGRDSASLSKAYAARGMKKRAREVTSTGRELKRTKPSYFKQGGDWWHGRVK